MFDIFSSFGIFGARDPERITADPPPGQKASTRLVAWKTISLLRQVEKRGAIDDETHVVSLNIEQVRQLLAVVDDK